MNAPTRRFTVTSESGMCNRLRVLLSGKAIAEATTREFAMLWKPNVACGAHFSQLFENNWRIGADVAFDTAHAYDVTIMPWSRVPNWLTLTTSQVFVANWGWLMQPARFATHTALQTRTEELMNELTPLPEIMQRVEEFKQNFFDGVTIGVHLRRGDMTRDRPDTTRNLDPTIQQIDAWLDTTNDARILLCTDDGARNPYSGEPTPYENVRAHFLQRYGKRVIFASPAHLDRATPKAIQDALVDLWLLRATNFFVGTLGSSFSELAVYGRNIPFTRTEGTTPQYQQHVRLMQLFGITALLARLGHYEYGRIVPYTCLRGRYIRRMRKTVEKHMSKYTFWRQS